MLLTGMLNQKIIRQILIIVFILCFIGSYCYVLSLCKNGQAACKNWKTVRNRRPLKYKAVCWDNQDKHYDITVRLIKQRCREHNTYYRIMKTYKKGKQHCYVTGNDRACPNKGNQSPAAKRISIRCGKFTCSIKYNDCDLCPILPWYTYYDISTALTLYENHKLNCKNLFANGRKIRSSGEICLKCNGRLVNKVYCNQHKANKTDFYMDASTWTPSWSKWVNVSGCSTKLERNSTVKCGNGSIEGFQKWSRNCSYSRGKTTLPTWACGSGASSKTLKCYIRKKPCHPMASLRNEIPHISSQRNYILAHLPHRSNPKRNKITAQDSYTWLLIIVLIFVVFFLIVLASACNNRLKQEKREEAREPLLPKQVQDASHENKIQNRELPRPREIILEPEYSEVKDRIQRSENSTAGREPIYEYASDVRKVNFYSDYSDDSLDSSGEGTITIAAEATEKEKLVSADERRNLYARVTKTKSCPN